MMLNNTPDILTLKEVCTILKIGKNTALKLLQNRDLEGFRAGNQWRVTKESLFMFIRRNSN